MSRVVPALRRLAGVRAAIAGAAVGLLVAAQLGGLGPPPGTASGAEGADGRVIVRFRDGQAARAGRAAAAHGARRVAATADPGTQLWLVEPGREREVAARLAADPEVEYAEPDARRGSPRPIAGREALAVPDDPLYGAYQWNLPKVNAPPAWDVTAGDPSVIVAVIDSGFDVGHPDRPASLRLGCDYVTWGAGGYAGGCPTVSGDANGHGTHVGGIVAARQNNALGISGLAPGVTLLAIRTADADGASYLSDVSAAIREATDAGARVINLSLGGTSSTLDQQSAVDYAVGHGVVVVAAAGNEYQEGNPTSYPAAYPGVVAVASASDTDQHSSFSNTGSYVSISAPGGSASGSTDSDVHHWITSLYPTDRGLYQLVNGTSQATPHVAAALGLMFSARPSLSGAEATSLIKSTARPLGGSVPNATFGYGYLDAGAAVRAAQQSGASVPTATPVPAVPTATPMPLPPVGTPAAGMSRLYVPGVTRGASGL